MSYAEISTPSFELIPVLIDSRRTQTAAQPAPDTRRAASRRRPRYQAIELLDQALYLSLASGFVVMVCGFIGMIR